MKKRPTIIYENERLENGSVRRVTRVVMRDYDVPFTPQSGIDTKIGNIGYMVKTNVRLEHKAAYLSKMQSGNPYDLCLIGQHLNNSVENAERIANEKSKK